MRFAEKPPLATVRCLGRGPVTDRVAALSVAQPQLRGVAALVPVGTPARETPVVRSLLLRHPYPLKKIAPPMRAAGRRRQRAYKPGSVRRAFKGRDCAAIPLAPDLHPGSSNQPGRRAGTRPVCRPYSV